MGTGTDLIPVGSDSSFAVLRMEADELRSIIQSNLGGATVDPSMLDRVKLPAGGGIMWEVPTIDGVEGMKSLEGVILHWGTRRTYWKDKYGEGEAGAPPECASDDGIYGHGNPGGACQSCSLNVFGSGEGNSKACQEVRQLFILPEDSIIPIVVHATPGSLKSVSEYFMRLLRAGIPSTAVVTKLTLKKATNKAGQGFSQIECAAGKRLDPDARARIEELAESLKPLFARTSVEHDDL